MSELSETSGDCDGCGEYNDDCVCNQPPADYYEPPVELEGVSEWQQIVKQIVADSPKISLDELREMNEPHKQNILDAFKRTDF